MFHYDFNQSTKAELEAYLERASRPTDVLKWIELILLIRNRMELPALEETVEDIVAAAEATKTAAETGPLGQALVVAGKLDQARYASLGALVVDVDQQLPADVTHVGFYVDGAIQPTIPRIEADYPRLLFSSSTASQLQATGKQADARVAALIEESLRVEDVLAHGTHRLLLLSSPEDPLTILLDEPVRNTKQRNGKPLAWAVGPKVVRLAAISKGPKTTDALEKLEAEMA